MALLPSPEYEFAGQYLQVASALAAVASLYVPPQHREHAAVPVTSLNLPASHASQLPPSGPV